ncbi:MAG: hypothetical protein ACQEUI_13140 [Actinomycetota bacterium]
MGTTPLRPPEGEARPKDLDLLDGNEPGRPSSARTGRGRSDLHGQFGPYPRRFPLRSERHHRPGKRSGWILGAAFSLIAIAAVVIATSVLTAGEDAIQPEPEAEVAIEAPLTARELGRDPGPTARPSATDVIVLDFHGLTEAPTVAAVPKVSPGEMLPM